VKSDASVGERFPVDPAYAGFTTADEAITHVQKTGTKFQRALASRLKSLMKGVKVVLVNNIDEVPAGPIREEFTAGTNAAGLYADSTETIYLNNMDGQSGTDATTVLHESLHAATLRVIVAWLAGSKVLSVKQAQHVNQLNNIMLAANKRLEERRNLGLLTAEELALYEVGAFTDLREFVTYGMTNGDMQNFLLKTEGTFVESSSPLELLANVLTRFVSTIRKLFDMDEEHSSAFQDLIIATDKLLSAANMKLPPIAVTAANRITREASLLAKQTASAKSTEFPGIIGRMVKSFRSPGAPIQELRNLFHTTSSKTIQALVPVLATDDLVRWVGDKIRNYKVINRLVNEMAGWRNTHLRAAFERTESWVKFAKSKPAAQKLLGTIMQISTIVGVDPSLHTDLATALKNDAELKELIAKAQDPQLDQGQRNAAMGRVTARTNELKLVHKLWDNLGKLDTTGEAKRIYSAVKKEYAKMLDLQEAELVKKIQLSKELAGDSTDPASPKGKLLAEITHSFQEARRRGVYFPLVRYGHYWLRVGKPGTKASEFHMFESEYSRDAFAESIAKDKGKSKAQMLKDSDMDLGNDPGELRKQVESSASSQMLKNVYELLDTQKQTSDIDDIKSAVYQMYLHTLPDRDMRKRFLKRQNRTGYNTDTIRNYITTQHSAINQIARLKYAGDVRLALDSAKEELVGNPDAVKLKTFVDEMAKRANMEIQPSDNPNNLLNGISSLGNKIVFYYMMTAPKSAMIQLTQLPIVAFPVLGAKYGWGKTMALMPKYLNVFKSLSTTRTDMNGEVVTEWGQPSLQNASYITEHPDPEYRKVMSEAWERLNNDGVFTVTYAGDMSERGNKPTAAFNMQESPVGSGLRVVANFMSGAFHHMERLSREVMAMSSFELAYAKAIEDGASVEEARSKGISEATALTKEGLFNFTAFNKPRLFRHPLGRLPTQFMTFPLQMTSYLVRNFFGMLPFVNESGKKEAAEKFFTTMAMTFMFAGATGLPMYSLLMGMLDKYRELMRPKLEADPHKYGHYDEADPNNIWGKRSYDLYFRNTVLPSYFGNGSSLANALGLTEAQAQTLSRGIELGPISALLDRDIGTSVGLNNMWFRDDSPSDSNRSAFEKMLVSFMGPFGSMGSQMAGALDDFENGDIQPGLEKISPAFYRGALVATRLQAEGSRTPGQDAQILEAEYYNMGQLLTRGLGFASTTEDQIKKANSLAKEMEVSVNKERTGLIDRTNSIILAVNKNPTDAKLLKQRDAVVHEIQEFDARNPWTPIYGDTISNSLSARQRQAAISSNFQGLSVQESQLGVFLPMVKASRTKK
jgi:hypothetical protein